MSVVPYSQASGLGNLFPAGYGQSSGYQSQFPYSGPPSTWPGASRSGSSAFAEQQANSTWPGPSGLPSNYWSLPSTIAAQQANQAANGYPPQNQSSGTAQPQQTPTPPAQPTPWQPPAIPSIFSQTGSQAPTSTPQQTYSPLSGMNLPGMGAPATNTGGNVYAQQMQQYGGGAVPANPNMQLQGDYWPPPQPANPNGPQTGVPDIGTPAFLKQWGIGPNGGGDAVPANPNMQHQGDYWPLPQPATNSVGQPPSNTGGDPMQQSGGTVPAQLIHQYGLGGVPANQIMQSLGNEGPPPQPWNPTPQGGLSVDQATPYGIGSNGIGPLGQMTGAMSGTPSNAMYNGLNLPLSPGGGGYQLIQGGSGSLSIWSDGGNGTISGWLGGGPIGPGTPFGGTHNWSGVSGANGYGPGMTGGVVPAGSSADIDPTTGLLVQPFGFGAGTNGNGLPPQYSGSPMLGQIQNQNQNAIGAPQAGAAGGARQLTPGFLIEPPGGFKGFGPNGPGAGGPPGTVWNPETDQYQPGTGPWQPPADQMLPVGAPPGGFQGFNPNGPGGGGPLGYPILPPNIGQIQAYPGGSPPGTGPLGTPSNPFPGGAPPGGFQGFGPQGQPAPGLPGGVSSPNAPGGGGPPGFVRNPVTGQWQSPAESEGPPGTIWDPVTGQWQPPTASGGPPGTVWNPGTAQWQSPTDSSPYDNEPGMQPNAIPTPLPYLSQLSQYQPNAIPLPYLSQYPPNAPSGGQSNATQSTSFMQGLPSFPASASGGGAAGDPSTGSGQPFVPSGATGNIPQPSPIQADGVYTPQQQQMLINQQQAANDTALSGALAQTRNNLAAQGLGGLSAMYPAMAQQLMAQNMINNQNVGTNVPISMAQSNAQMILQQQLGQTQQYGTMAGIPLNYYNAQVNASSPIWATMQSLLGM